MPQLFSEEILRHIAKNAARGDDTDADTVCHMVGDLLRAARIEAAARDVVAGVGPAEVAALREALDSKALDRPEDAEEEDVWNERTPCGCCFAESE